MLPQMPSAKVYNIESETDVDGNSVYEEKPLLGVAFVPVDWGLITWRVMET